MLLRAFFVILSAFPLLAVDATLLNLVPADAKTIAGIDVSQTTASPFGQYLLGKMQGDDRSFSDFVAATGFDPRRDLSEVVMATNAVGKDAHDNGVILARGRFDVPKILSAAQQHGAKTMKLNGVDVIQGREERPGWVALLDDSTAVVGPQALVQAVLAQRGTSSQLAPALLDSVRDYSTRYQAWMVTTAPLGNFAGNVPDKQLSGAMQGGLAQSIQQVNGGVRFGTNIDIAGQAVTRSDKDAQALVDVVKFLAGLAQANSQNQPEAARFAKLLASLNVKTDGSSMIMSLSLPEADIEGLLNQAPAVAKKSARGADRGVTRQSPEVGR
jgi:hypothetical protein